jgi:hypothetical protein
MILDRLRLLAVEASASPSPSHPAKIGPEALGALKTIVIGVMVILGIVAVARMLRGGDPK